jgi:2-dehydro-3-deoxyglucarate aldolase/4-hydroxy-2-oxoheptanedioate aldolase
MRINTVKKALKEGKLQVGCSLSQIRSTEVPMILARAGFDWTFLDGEHGRAGVETLADLSRACTSAGVCPIVRVADIQYALIARSLDCGAQGILFPRVETRELLERAVSFVKFPPVGQRGFGMGPAHIEWERASIPQMIAHFNENTMVVLQIESQLAVDRRDDLLSVPGVDAVMIGPADLSVSLGVPGEFEHPRMVEAIEKVRDSCLRHGVAPGIHCRSAALAKQWIQNGMKFVSTGSESSFLFEKASEVASALKS